MPEDKPRSARRKALKADPTQFGFLALLREIERSRPDLPRIGRNRTLRDEAVRLAKQVFDLEPEQIQMDHAQAIIDRNR